MGEPLKTAPEVALEKVEWRVDSEPIEKQGRPPVCRYVPYLDAAKVAALLDEWVGPGNWSDRYEPGDLSGKPVLWCFLGIRVEGEWVVKRDVGVASNMEAEKGMVSDAFKRAAILKWGVGRNVYELPTLWGPCDVRERNGKKTPYPNRDTNAALLRALDARGIHNATAIAGTGDDADSPTPGAGTDGEGGAPVAADSSPSPLPASNEEKELASRPCELCGSKRAGRTVVGGKVRCQNATDCEKRAREPM